MFRAYDAGRERLVAVKLFKLDLPPERVHKLVAGFEQLIAAELTHPAMAVPLAAGITDVSAYLAMDYVAAESLDLAVREYGPAPPSDALRVAAQLAGALDFAAVVNINHGTLHPRDVLLSADETRLTGVGIARALETAGVVAPVRRPYTAPERMAGSAWDRRADVFSLAALVFELLWGRRITGTGAHVVEGLTELHDGDLDVLRSVFARALADDPKERYDTALEFAEALKSAFPEVALSEPAPRKKAAKTAEHEPRLPLDAPEEAGLATAAAGPKPRATGPAHDQVARGFSAANVANDSQVDQGFSPAKDAAPEPAKDLDLDIRAAEDDRFHEVETAPAIVPVVADSPTPPIGVPRESVEPVERPPISMIDQSRSAVWPLVAALVIGLAIGFAGGYGVGTRERSATPAVAVAEPPIAPPVTTQNSPAPAGREATEVAIAEAPRPSMPTTTAAVTPPPPPTPEPPKPARSATRRTTPPTSARPTAAGAATPGRPSAATGAATSGRSTSAAPAASSGRRAGAPPAVPAGRYVGSLSVESKPPGARVFLDGRVIGTTPLAVPSVPAGEHAIRLELDGYRRWSSSLRVVAAEQNRVTASLER